MPMSVSTELRDATSQLSGYATKPSTSTHNHRIHSKECNGAVIIYLQDTRYKKLYLTSVT